MSLTKKFQKSSDDCIVTFCLPKAAANGAREVKIVGDFNDWDTTKAVTMKKKNGEFRASINLPRDQEYQFRYLIDDVIWENDWEADKYVQSPFGVDNSVIITS